MCKYLQNERRRETTYFTQMSKMTIGWNNLRNSFIHTTQMMQFRADLQNGTTDIELSSHINFGASPDMRRSPLDNISCVNHNNWMKL
jgi:hypothetical protein